VRVCEFSPLFLVTVLCAQHFVVEFFDAPRFRGCSPLDFAIFGICHAVLATTKPALREFNECKPRTDNDPRLGDRYIAFLRFAVRYGLF
jgi:hypothetical protein